MLESFSMRARKVVFAARFKAGERGAKMIDTGDLLVGSILEDQRVVPQIHADGQAVVSKVPPHIPFFPSKIAEDLLAKLVSPLPQSQPVATTAEMPLSPSVKRVCDSAKALQTRLQHTEIEPSHLLAAILTEESSQGVKLLQDSGITEERVLLKLGGVTGN